MQILVPEEVSTEMKKVKGKKNPLEFSFHFSRGDFYQETCTPTCSFSPSFPAVSHPSHRSQPGMVLTLGQGNIGSFCHLDSKMPAKRRMKILVPEEESTETKKVKGKKSPLEFFFHFPRGDFYRETCTLTSSFSPSHPAVSHPSHCSQPGLVLTLGQGNVGQLGLGEDIMERKKPALVTLPEMVVQVEAGGMHTVCLSQTGKVSAVGSGMCCGAEGRNQPLLCSHLVPALGVSMVSWTTKFRGSKGGPERGL